MLETILIVVHVTACLFLIFVVLLQSGQAADLAGAFGGGGSQTALGMRGATTLLHKLTTGAAVLFMLTSLALGLVGRQSTSVIEGVESAPAEQPATPAAPGQDAGTGTEEGTSSRDSSPGDAGADGGTVDLRPGSFLDGVRVGTTDDLAPDRVLT